MGHMNGFNGPEWNGDYTCNACGTNHVGDPYLSPNGQDLCSPDCYYFWLQDNPEE